MVETRNLDDEFVGAQEVPGKPRNIWDDEVSGFGIRLLPSGRRNWIVGYRGLRSGGKKGSQRRVIGAHGEMTVEEARQRAREVLANVAAEEASDSRQEEPAGGASAEPDRPAEPPPDDAAAEEAPPAGAAAETAAAAEASADEEYDLEPGEEPDPETGEIRQAASEAGAAPSHDEDLDFGRRRTAAGEPGPEEGAGDEDRGGGSNPDVSEVVRDTIGSVGGAPQDGVEPEPSAADAPVRPAWPAEEPPAEHRSGGRGAPQDDRDDGEVAAEREPELPEDAGRAEPAGSASAEDKEPERPKLPGAAVAAKATVRAVGKAAGGIAGLVRKGGAGQPAAAPAKEAAREPEDSGAPAPQSARPAEPPAGEERVGEEALAGASGQLKRHTADTEASGEKTRAARDMNDETVAGFAHNLGEMREQLDRVDTATGSLGPRLDDLATAMSVSTRDLRRRRRRRVRMALAAAVLAAPVVFAAGGAVQWRFELVPPPDESLGWKDHVWNHYGEAFMGCFQRAKETESGWADCKIKVRGR